MIVNHAMTAKLNKEKKTNFRDKTDLTRGLKASESNSSLVTRHL